MNSSLTDISLLSRLKKDDRDGDAWRRFVDRYGSRLFEWCLQRGLKTHDAEDVTQGVLIKIARNISSFEYDPTLTFRGWLRRITENAIKDYYRERRSREASMMVDDGMAVLVTEAASEDLLVRLNEAFDLELLEHAIDRVRSRVDHRRWLAWKKCARDRMSGKDVAAALNMKLSTVYAARYKIQMLIAEEVALLEQIQRGEPA